MVENCPRAIMGIRVIIVDVRLYKAQPLVR
jgi:hypothetical protein